MRCSGRGQTLTRGRCQPTVSIRQPRPSAGSWRGVGETKQHVAVAWLVERAPAGDIHSSEFTPHIVDGEWQRRAVMQSSACSSWATAAARVRPARTTKGLPHFDGRATTTAPTGLRDSGADATTGSGEEPRTPRYPVFAADRASIAGTSIAGGVLRYRMARDAVSVGDAVRQACEGRKFGVVVFAQASVEERPLRVLGPVGGDRRHVDTGCVICSSLGGNAVARGGRAAT